MILLIDNYDSFSYNLYQLIGKFNPDIKIIRNDEMTVQQIDAMHPEAIILSPGPGKPENAGICVEVVKELGSKYKILGVCLGHQSICKAYGATVSYARELMHGKQSMVSLAQNEELFQGLPKEIPVARYHSLAAVKESVPASLVITAETKDGEIMAVKHVKNKVYGLQFHPESILTPDGEKIIRNFLEI